MKILHCSDLHLESAYNVVSKEYYRQLKDEALEIFSYLCSYAKENGIEAVLICGDLFDGTNVRKSAIKYIFQQVEALKDISFYYIQGNHDAKLNLNIPERPENFIIIGESFMRFDIGDRVSIGGVSLSKQNVETFYNDIEFEDSRFNIFMLHADTMFGNHDPTQFSNVDINLLKNKKINYLALGHIHKRSEGKLDDRGIYCNSGNCGNYGFGEESERGFVVIDVQDKTVNVARHPVPLKRNFIVIAVDVSKFGSEKIFDESIARVLLNQKREDFVRIKLVGYFDESFDKRIDYLTSKYRDRFFYFDIRDESKLNIDLEKIKEEKLSLKYEFLSQVFSKEDLSDDVKNKIAYAGIQALRGEDITV